MSILYVASGRTCYLKPSLYKYKYTLNNKTTKEHQIIAKPSHSQTKLKNAHNSQQLCSEASEITHLHITILEHNCHYLKQSCFKYPCIRGHTKLHFILVLMFLPLLIWSRWQHTLNDKTQKQMYHNIARNISNMTFSTYRVKESWDGKELCTIIIIIIIIIIMLVAMNKIQHDSASFSSLNSSSWYNPLAS
jgi:hypothetical protein